MSAFDTGIQYSAILTTRRQKFVHYRLLKVVIAGSVTVMSKLPANYNRTKTHSIRLTVSEKTRRNLTPRLPQYYPRCGPYVRMQHVLFHSGF